MNRICSKQISYLVGGVCRALVGVLATAPSRALGGDGDDIFFFDFELLDMVGLAAVTVDLAVVAGVLLMACLLMPCEIFSHFCLSILNCCPSLTSTLGDSSFMAAAAAAIWWSICELHPLSVLEHSMNLCGFCSVSLGSNVSRRTLGGAWFFFLWL